MFKRLPIGYVLDSTGKVVLHSDQRVCEAIRLVFLKFRERWTIRQTFMWFRDHDIELPANPVLGTGLVWIRDHHEGYIDWSTYEENRQMTRRNSVNWQGNESMAAIRAGQGLLVGLPLCGHCGRKLHVRYWGGTGTNARYLCKGDYDDGGQYCLGFGGASVDRRLGQEVLKVISPLGVEASLKALEELSAGDAAQRAALSSKLEQLEYEAKKAFEQYDAVDARNRLVAGELERRWNEKLEEVETTKQRLSSLNGKRWSLSSDEEESIRLMGENFAESWHSDHCPPALDRKS